VEEVTINIEGMSCDHCVNRVKNVLEELEGVSGAAVSLKEGCAHVHYDPNSVGLEAIRGKIREVGYEVTDG
jgi:copper ion binding protein